MLSDSNITATGSATRLLCPRVIARVVEKFDQIVAGMTPLDPNIDVYSSEELRLTRLQIIARLATNLPTLKTLLDHETRVFEAGVRDEFPGPASAWRWDRFLRLATCRKLTLELSPRTEVLERLVDELTDVADELKHLVMANATAGCPAARTREEKIPRQAVYLR